MAFAALKDVADVVGLSVDAFRQQYRKSGIIYRGLAGVRAVNVDTLPFAVRALYLAARPPAPEPSVTAATESEPPAEDTTVAVADNLRPLQPLPQLQAEIAQAYSEAPDFNKRRVDKYDPILKACVGLFGAELTAFVADWNHSHPDRRTSYQSVMRMRRDVARHGAAALVGGYGKARGASIVPDELYEYFKALYMTDRRRTIADSWQKTVSWALGRGYEFASIPKAGAFMRALKNDVPEGALHRARYGHESYNRKYGTTMKRDYSDLLAGEYWVSDHSRLDLFVLDPVSGKPVRPELTVWRDMKSGYWLSYDLHIEPSSSYHIFKAFREAAKRYGVPSDILVDNGKDFRSKDFSGGRKGGGSKPVVAIEQNRLSMCEKLNITVHFATPYHGQTKPIERDFKILEEKLCKDFNSYKGNSVANTPESLKKALASQKIATFDEFKAHLESFVAEVMNRRVISSGYRKGKSPLEIMNEEFNEAAMSGKIKKVDDEQLNLLCYRTSQPMTISRNWIKDSQCGVEYYADWILGFVGKKVYLRRNYDEMTKALVYDYETNEFLGEVRMAERVPALAKAENQKKALERRTAEIKSAEKITRIMSDPGAGIEELASLSRYIKSRENADVAGVEPPNIESTIAAAMLTDESKVIVKRAAMEKEGLADISIYGYDSMERPRKPRTFSIESELEDAYNAGDPDAVAIVESRKQAV